jgi:hypothetical protein
MKKLMSSKIIFLVLFIMLSCNINAQNKWEKIEYYFNVGSLPPPYHYSYTIAIDKEGNGKMQYVGAYVSTESNTSEYTFGLSKKNLKKLKKEIKESNILNLDIKSRPNEEIPDGGHSDGLQIFGYDKNDETNKVVSIKIIPPYPELKYENVLNKLYKTITNSVPEDIWKDIESKKGK